LLPGIALIVLAALIVCTTPIIQVFASRQALASRLGIQPATLNANQIASSILSYTPAPLRSVFGIEPLSTRAASSPEDPAGMNAASMLTTFTKTAFPAAGSTVAAGGTITYTVTVINDEFFDDLGVLLTDATPANTTFVSLSISQQPVNGPNWICATPVAGSTGAIVCQPNDSNRTFLAGLAGVSQNFQFQYTVRVNETLAVGTTITSNPAHYTAAAGDFDTFGGPVDRFSDNNTAVTHTVVHSTDL